MCMGILMVGCIRELSFRQGIFLVMRLCYASLSVVRLGR
jgi:hypothetical protein